MLHGNIWGRGEPVTYKFLHFSIIFIYLFIIYHLSTDSVASKSSMVQLDINKHEITVLLGVDSRYFYFKLLFSIYKLSHPALSSFKHSIIFVLYKNINNSMNL